MSLLVGDCRQVLKSLPDCSVDAIITDPPYELGFMGKSWDSTGVAYDVTVWQECLRVLKHGGHLLAFGGSRTYHRLAVAIEDAGFQIRDQIMWVYGSGFPKSLNIGKAIDKAAGAERQVVGKYQSPENTSGGKGRKFCHTDQSLDGLPDITAPATPEAKQWDGWGTALKPAHEPIVMARKPLDGTVANNVLTHGVGGINIDRCRVSRADGDDSSAGNRTANFATQEIISGGNGSGGWQQSESGRFPANFIHDGSDEVLELFPDTAGSWGVRTQRPNRSPFVSGNKNLVSTNQRSESGSAARFFYCAKASKKDRNEGLDGFAEKREADRIISDGVGGNNPRNRSNTPKLNHHPTVKPTELMRYLCRLVTPPNGTVLDPFTGSGSTGKAATLEGFTFIGIEQSAEYAKIANARIQHAQQSL